MSDNQNPVFTDNTTILGDGTENNPLHSSGGGGSVGNADDVQLADGAGGFTVAQDTDASERFSFFHALSAIARASGGQHSLAAGSASGNSLTIDGNSVSLQAVDAGGPALVGIGANGKITISSNSDEVEIDTATEFFVNVGGDITFDLVDSPRTATLDDATGTCVFNLFPGSAVMNINKSSSAHRVTIFGLHINIPDLQIFANNAAAITGGLIAGDLYRSGADPDVISVVH